MRRVFAAALAACVSMVVWASEPVAVSLPVAEAVAPILAQELPPSPSLARATAPGKTPEFKPAAKPRTAKKAGLNKSMLSRTARNQIALLAAAPAPGKLPPPHIFDDDDADAGITDLDLHRSFARPRVVKVQDMDEEDGADIAEHVKLRLFLARMKAVEAHKMAQAADDGGDEDLSDNARLRLFLARTQALKAHGKKFS